MDYLMGLLEGAPSGEQSGRCLLASSALEDAPDFFRALFAAGATPGEVRASVAEVFSPPRSLPWLRGGHASVCSQPGRSTYAQGLEGSRGTSTDPRTAI
eukprot:2974063-Alexandrium_andersonii.AAC.1